MNQQMKEETHKVVLQKQEEINRVKEELEEQQQRQLSDAKAMEENSRYASDTLAVC